MRNLALFVRGKMRADNILDNSRILQPGKTTYGKKAHVNFVADCSCLRIQESSNTPNISTEAQKQLDLSKKEARYIAVLD